MIAFVLDASKVHASEDGMTLPPLPGLWTNTRPILPSALGLDLKEMRQMVEDLDLPLVEVEADPDEAHAEFPTPPHLLATETVGLAAHLDAADAEDEADPNDGADADADEEETS